MGSMLDGCGGGGGGAAFQQCKLVVAGWDFGQGGQVQGDIKLASCYVCVDSGCPAGHNKP